jgi:hypothetical protein
MLAPACHTSLSGKATVDPLKRRPPRRLTEVIPKTWVSSPSAVKSVVPVPSPLASEAVGNFTLPVMSK